MRTESHVSRGEKYDPVNTELRQVAIGRKLSGSQPCLSRVRSGRACAAAVRLRYSGLLQVRLTTIDQACSEIRAAALISMPDRPPHANAGVRDLLADSELVVRRATQGGGPVGPAIAR